MKKTALTFLGLFLLTAAPRAESPRFEEGDRWVAIGDSITHGRRYHSFVYLFHATRFPERPFRAFNCGISGDSAAGAVRRFEWDIAPHRPTVATIMLGMNDVSRGLYAPGQSGEAVGQRREDAIRRHLEAMAQLSGKLRAQSCRLIFITPSIYDQTGDLPAENRVGVNDALGRCGEGARKLAGEAGGAVIDLHGPMTALNARLQQTNLAATLVGPDRVHPGDPGQLVMAYQILKGMGVSGTVASVGLDAAAGTVATQENCTITGLRGRGAKLAFTVRANALPYPVLPAAEPALQWVPFTEELNREMLRVTGLPAGAYSVRIDGQVVALASADELAAGVNLAANPRSPMLRQALKVLAVEEQRHAIAARMRTFAAQRHWLTRSHPDLDMDDFAAVKATLLADLEKKQGTSNYGYFRGQMDLYLTWKPREAELLRELEDHTTAIWQLNRPVPHHFEITPQTAADRLELSGRIIDEGEDTDSWRNTSWTDREPTLKVADGALVVTGVREAGHRDMLGLTKRVNIDLAGVKALRIRYRADAGAPFGVEVVLDGQLTRLRSYEKATGEWEELALPLKAARLTGLTLILAESGKDQVWPEEKVTYRFDRIWLE